MKKMFFQAIKKEKIKYLRLFNFLLIFIISFYFEELYSDIAY